MYSNDNYDISTLEFGLFVNSLKSCFLSSFAKELIDSLAPKASVNDAVEFQQDLEVCMRLYDGKTPPLGNDELFYRLYNGILSENPVFLTLEPEEYIFLSEHILLMGSLRKYLDSRITVIERLSPFLSLFNPDVEFALKIDGIFEANGEMKDSASTGLAHIRRSIKNLRKRAQVLLGDMLKKGNADKYIQESVVTLRNNRYTIACKTNFSQYISGIVHDRSATGQTLYVEPAQCIPVNNELQDAILAESAEISKVLKELLEDLKQRLKPLKQTVDSYAEIVYRLELAGFYYSYDITFPEFKDNINLVAVHHPLLKISKKGSSVPIDIKLEKKQKLMVVTGPNTGGKTAALKSLGLNHIIALSGLPVMAKHADMVFFTRIKADIGDKQSLVMDLSTFSSHMTNIKKMLDCADSSSLILFDELGTGTDPKEGAALAVSILDYLCTKGATVGITTHFSELKAYAYESGDAKMYAVDFDYDNFEPRYRLLENVSGSSDPLIIAERLSFPAQIILDAKKYLEGYKSTAETTLEQAHLIRAEAERCRRDLAEQSAVFEAEKEEFARRKEAFKEKLSKKELELLEDAYSLLQKGKRLAAQKQKDPVEKIDDELAKTGERIEKLKSARKTVENIAAGDVIMLEKYGRQGRIISIEGNFVNINMDGLKVKLPYKELVGKKVEQLKPAKVKLHSQSGASLPKRELFLVGKRVEEALDIMDKYIDESVVAGFDRIYIVHGRGSGQLRKAVHEYLRSRGIKQYALAPEDAGGNAVTEVWL